MEKQLHIVSFDVPYPADYGGVIDVFYRIVALHYAGVQIHLHCFEYGRGVQPELERYCSSVRYYPRREGHKGISHRLPYIVASRINEELYKNLLEDNHPILLEGIHCSGILQDPRFANRKILLRLHNAEFAYYGELARSTSSLFKKLFFHHECRLLKIYESSIARHSLIAAMTGKDVETYQREFHAESVYELPPFVPFNEVRIPEGNGFYCLYHGNLSVPENEKAASFLLSEVFNDLNIPLVVAGKNPSPSLEKLAHRKKNTCLVANPSHREMQEMIGKAQLHIIPAFNRTGVKLKLLNALYNGRHCVVNEAAVEGTGLEPACHIAGNADAFKSIVHQLYNQPFGEEEIRLREKLLQQTFNNSLNAGKIIQWLW